MSDDASQTQGPPRPRIRAGSFNQYFLLALMVGLAVVIYNMVRVFLVPIMLAAVFAGLFYPMYRRFLALLRQRRGTSAFVCCLVLLLCLLAPAYFTANLLARQAADFYTTVQQWAVQLSHEDPNALYTQLRQESWFQLLRLDRVDWQKSLEEGSKSAGGVVAGVINKTSRGTFQLIGSLALTFFTMFYFFRDGERLVARLKYLSPLEEQYETALIDRFVSVSQAVVKGTLLIGLTQGVLGGLTLWAFGFTSPLLWGAVMVILSLIPMVGSWLVLYPAAIIELATGHVLAGVAIFLVSTLIISSVDNVMRPWLVGRDTGMHDLVTFFSTLGGIALFGLMGFILGPVIAALFLTILDFYTIEFRQHLEAKAL
jgi:predicted PurR-regulated permease PerM